VPSKKALSTALDQRDQRVCQINGLSTSQRKIDREPDEVVRMLQAQRNANLFLQNQR
jgi:hypothetical protein